MKINSFDFSSTDETYFIADIAANHDGDLNRAKRLITLAAEAGAHAAKFQHFRADHIVSDAGFRNLGAQISHQASWAKPVAEIYADASIPWEWTPELAQHCADEEIAFFSAPYDLEAVDHLDPYVPAYKVGSGDVTWLEILEKIANKGKPVLLATGASDLAEVDRAVATITAINPVIAVMQCNTNYTGADANFDHINLRVLNSFSERYPEAVLGLSDHTAGPATVLGAIALGARVVEKHFTDDTNRKGPDHAFSTDPVQWRTMVDLSSQLVRSLGDGQKRVQDNEIETNVIQRRGVRVVRDIPAGTVISRAELSVLRPAPHQFITADEVGQVVGRTTKVALSKDSGIAWSDLQS